MDIPMRDLDHLLINSDILYEISRQVGGKPDRPLAVQALIPGPRCITLRTVKASKPFVWYLVVLETLLHLGSIALLDCIWTAILNPSASFLACCNGHGTTKFLDR